MSYHRLDGGFVFREEWLPKVPHVPQASADQKNRRALANVETTTSGIPSILISDQLIA